jgi:hypothetical protein
VALRVSDLWIPYPQLGVERKLQVGCKRKEQAEKISCVQPRRGETFCKSAELLSLLLILISGVKGAMPDLFDRLDLLQIEKRFMQRCGVLSWKKM